MPEWRFRRMQPGEMNIDPIEGEFFSTEALDSLSDALVREAIQNSLDARFGEEGVRLRLLFSTGAATPEARYFDGLWPHLSAPGSGVSALPNRDGSLDYLLIEDFGTRGLQGDPSQSEDQDLNEPDSRNDFYYFWRNIGRSRKGLSDLGRWGLGKTVFPAASRLNAFLALSVRADDQRCLLMGQSVLRIHKVRGERHYPYGYFGDFEGDFSHPVEDAPLLERFRQDFGLARTAEPGLSVLLPWPDADITPESVLGSVIRHYFAPILAGDLVVEIVTDSGSERLDATTLSQVLPVTRSLDLEESSRLARLVELTRFGQTLPREEHIRLPAPLEGSAPRWRTSCLEGAPVDLSDRFDAGRPLAFTVPVWVKPADEEPVLSEFDVYLERDETLIRADEHFLREGITVAGVRGALPKGIRGIVFARDPPLAALLGDAENPAHTEWQERSPKFKNRYRHGPFTLRYVRNAPREIVRALTRPAAGRNERLLQHLFSLEVPTEAEIIEPERGLRTEAGPGTSPGPGAVDASGGASTPFALMKINGGFCLSGAGNGELPRHAAVQVAYEVRRGNPFSRYQPPDFDLNEAPISVLAEGASVERREGNLLVLQVHDADFRLSVEGFDPHRDIRVRVAPMEPRG